VRVLVSSTATLLGVLFVVGVPPSAGAEPTLADLIAAVRRNERLYDNVDVVMDSTYDIGARQPGGADEVVRSKIRTRFVTQGEWFRLERAGSSQTADRTTSLDHIRSFDGQTTRMLEQKAVGNIADERLEGPDFIRPHLLPISYAHVAVPFSVYLSGHDAIRAHANGRLAAGLTLRVSYEGGGEVGGLKCHKVLVQHVLKSGQTHDGEEFWLAADRNYLPVRLRAYTYRFSKDLPVGEAEVAKIEEVKPGVWFPREVIMTAYDKFRVQREGRQTVQWRERHVVNQVDLEPKLNRAYFAIVEFPAGASMYQLEKGKIVRSWRQGEP
jgi:hypothetical protein